MGRKESNQTKIKPSFHKLPDISETVQIPTPKTIYLYDIAHYGKMTTCTTCADPESFLRVNVIQDFDVFLFINIFTSVSVFLRKIKPFSRDLTRPHLELARAMSASLSATMPSKQSRPQSARFETLFKWRIAGGSRTARHRMLAG